MKVLLVGPQGSGKGTAGAAAATELGRPLVEVGKLLRGLSPDHPHYTTIHEQMNQGRLVEQKLVAEIISQYINENNYSNGYILDGWGRALIDLEYFNPGFDRVVVINLSREESIRRITGRRICTTTGKTYNIYTLPPEKLAECEGELVQRTDDTEEAVNKRLDIYYSETKRVIDSLGSLGLVKEVNGEQAPEKVAQDVIDAIKDL